MTGTPLTLLQKKDLAPQFVYDAVAKLIRVAAASADPGNILIQGSDYGAVLTEGAVRSAQITYTLALEGHLIKLYKTIDGVTTLQNTADTTTFDMHLASGSLVNGVLTLSGSNGEPDITIDFSAYLKFVSTLDSTSVAFAGQGNPGSPVTAAVKLSVNANNMLTIQPDGVNLSSADVLALITSNMTNAISVDPGNGVLRTTVLGKSATAPLVQANDLGGNVIGWLLANPT